VVVRSCSVVAYLININKDSFSYSIRTPWTNDKLNWFAIAVESHRIYRGVLPISK